MAKKKAQDTRSESTTPHEDHVPTTSPSERATLGIATAATGIALHPLLEEVQSFLTRRDELARQLADEIEATEKKLDELRRTAAALFPDGPPAPPKVRKPKKQTRENSGERSSKPAMNEEPLLETSSEAAPVASETNAADNPQE